MHSCCALACWKGSKTRKPIHRALRRRTRIRLHHNMTAVTTDFHHTTPCTTTPTTPSRFIHHSTTAFTTDFRARPRRPHRARPHRATPTSPRRPRPYDSTTAWRLSLRTFTILSPEGRRVLARFGGFKVVDRWHYVLCSAIRLWVVVQGRRPFTLYTL